jgi:transcription initiation factor TFIIE subunit alpha
MDLAVTLVRSVARSFLETRHVLIIDALIIHSALRDDDLSYLMGTNPKDLAKLCAKLRQDRFITVHSRPEPKPGFSRPINRTYYYINYRQAIDAIKWRTYSIAKDTHSSEEPVSEKKEYFCGFCKAEWTMMEVLDNVGRDGFLCHQCGRVLTHDLERNATGHEQSTRLNNQLKFITDLLARIDSSHIPESTFDDAFNRARPVVRDPTHPSQPSLPLESIQARPTAVRGMINTGPDTMSVNISTTDGPSEAERAAEQARKEKAALANALPSWMANSTVTGESYSGSAGAPSLTKRDDAEGKQAGGQADTKEQSEMDDYFARLKKQALQQPQPQDEYEDDEDDEGDFEDVVGAGGGALAPIVEDQPPQPKKVRVEETPVIVKPEPVDDGESDEDVEFEDV